MIGFTAVAVAVLYAVADRIVEDVLELESLWGQVLEIVVMAAMTSVVLWLGVLRPLHRQAAEQREAAEQRRGEIERTAADQRFESQLHRALEMAATEEMAYALIPRCSSPTPATPISSVHSPSTRTSQGCAVWSRRTTARRSVAHRAFSSNRVERSMPARTSTGVPVDRAQRRVFRSASVVARSACSTRLPDGHPPATDQNARLETVATQAGSRIGMLRVMSATTLQAATDPLTGLLNRRSFENNAHALVRQGRSFALAMGDLDHFKRLNDAHGHDAGDRALRLFARVLRNALRSEDIISRYGGEEFVIVFPDLTADQAGTALRRMQESLIVALADGSVPGFSVSYGVTDTSESNRLDELCRIADSALFRAKREGRNRVVVDEVRHRSAATAPIASAEILA
jgi:diguanylate cyclase (GGDEF)-like protein